MDDIRDLQPLVPYGGPMWPFLAALAALVLLALLVLYWRRRKPRAAPAPRPQPAAAPRPEPDAYAEAWAVLHALAADQLAEKGRFAEFYIRLSEAVRTYLGKVHALEAAAGATPVELLAHLRARQVPTALVHEAERFFHACDWVKFAAGQPGLEEAREAYAQAERIVEAHRPQPPAPAGKEAGRVAVG